MNLLEKALLIKDIQQTIILADNERAPLFQRAQAVHHLKEIFQICEKPITIQSPKSTHSSEVQIHLCNELLKLSKFQNSHRGLFYDRSLLLQALNQNPNMGWAILYDLDQKLWQIWLIPQARRGAIHCSWKGHLNEAYQWMLQQQNLLQCLLTDDEFNQRLGIETPIRPETSSEEPTVPSESEAPADTNKPITPERPERNLDIHQILPMRIEGFPQLCFEVIFQNQNEISQYLTCFSLFQRTTDIHYAPTVIAERMNTEGQFLGYIAILGVRDIQTAGQLAQQYCLQTETMLASVKTLSWGQFQTSYHSIDLLFNEYLQAKNLWQQQHMYSFIPASMILPQRFIPFEETQATVETPLLLIKERQKYRVVHGERRLKLMPNEIAYPCILLSRNDGISWQLFREIIETLPQPISVEALYTQTQKLLVEHQF
ncbi:hypothetical protein [Acinetobacter sp. MB5]|uniref:hypothetical protein n=1 Tax=Acinetobacter sp. MB5 TaxID=2069438 RepID=UPI000DCFC020|nr:hypothetical protein [Acinetobacter sp. MB5]